MYEVLEAKINKNLIGDEIVLKKVSKKPSILELILQRLDKMDARMDKH
jgi:hypothetical protein